MSEDWPIETELIAEVVTLLGGDETSTRLPRHRHDLEAGRVETVQRARILVATAREVADNGYVAARTRDICARAGVSSKTFYALYGDKESAFYSAFTLMDGVIVHQLRSLTTATMGVSDLRTMVTGFLDFLRQAPVMSRVHVMEARSAGPRVMARHAALADEFVDSVLGLARQARLADPRVAVPSRPVVAAVLGGVHELVFRHFAEHSVDTVGGLEGALTELLGRVFLPHLWPGSGD